MSRSLEKVTDSSGKPLDDATVMIYHAGVKKGYSTFCPSCYVDCGKRARQPICDGFICTASRSSIRICGLKLLVVRDGYTPKFVAKVDPSLGLAETAVLALRAPVDDPNRVALGRVVDSNGRPLRDAVVRPIGVATILEGNGPTSMYGTIPGLEPVAVTNPKGEFELAYGKNASGMLVKVEARVMAIKLTALPTGARTKDRFCPRRRGDSRPPNEDQGKPVARSEIGLFPQNNGGFGDKLKILGDPYEEIFGAARRTTAPSSSPMSPHRWIGTSTARWNQ